MVSIQSDLYTASRLATVLAALVTSNSELANIPGNVQSLEKFSSDLQTDLRTLECNLSALTTRLKLRATVRSKITCTESSPSSNAEILLSNTYSFVG